MSHFSDDVYLSARSGPQPQIADAKPAAKPLTIQDMQDRAGATEKRNGFREGPDRLRELVRTHGTPEDSEQFEVYYGLAKAMLMVTELAEAAEAIRKPHPDKHVPEMPNELVEYGDVAIRMGARCDELGWSLSDAIDAKMKANAKREKMHGGKKA